MQNTIQQHCYFVVQLPSFELVLINFNHSSKRIYKIQGKKTKTWFSVHFFV